MFEQARLTAELFSPGYTLPTRQIEEADLARTSSTRTRSAGDQSS